MEKKSIVQKRKMSRIFRRHVHGNGTEIMAGKICLKKMEKKLLVEEFPADFYETFENRVSCL